MTLLSMETFHMTCQMLIMPGVLHYSSLKMDSVKIHNVKLVERRFKMHENRDSFNVNKTDLTQ